MKKAFILPVVMFIVCFILDLVLYIIARHEDFGKNFNYYFLPAIFIEISIYGSIILNVVMKDKEKKIEKKEEHNDEQINIDIDKNKQ